MMFRLGSMLIFGVAACSLVFGSVQTAKACSWVPPGWQVGVLPELIEDVPIEGIVLVGMQYFTDGATGAPDLETAAEYIEIGVTDADGAIIPGSVTYDPVLRVAIWRADENLEANASYALSVRADNTSLRDDWLEDNFGFAADVEAVIDLITRAEATPPLQVPSLAGELVLTEWEDVQLACCDTGICGADSCGGSWCEQSCWAEAVELMPLLDFEFTVDAAHGRDYQVAYVIAQDTGDEWLYAPSSWQDVFDVEMRFSAEAESYCVTLVSESLITGERVEGSDLCVAHADLTPLVERQNEVSSPEPGVCATPGSDSNPPPPRIDTSDENTAQANPPGPDNESGENPGQSEPGDDSACRQAPSASHTWSLLLAVLCLVALRRVTTDVETVEASSER